MKFTDYTASAINQEKLNKFKSQLDISVKFNIENYQIEDIEWFFVVISVEDWG